jgi:site-specific DNA-methyltransferase (adenine-specific)
MITNTKAQNWRTPRPLFNRLNREYNFTIDLASQLGNALLPRYWTRAHNSLRRSWVGERGFWNPPFGAIRVWLEYALEQADRGAYSVGIVPQNTETHWYHDLAILADKHTFLGRVAYVPPPGVKASQPSFASMLVICGPTIKPSGYDFSRVRSASTGEYIDNTIAVAQARRLWQNKQAA